MNDAETVNVSIVIDDSNITHIEININDMNNLGKECNKICKKYYLNEKTKENLIEYINKEMNVIIEKYSLSKKKKSKSEILSDNIQRLYYSSIDKINERVKYMEKMKEEIISKEIKEYTFRPFSGRLRKKTDNKVRVEDRLYSDYINRRNKKLMDKLFIDLKKYDIINKKKKSKSIDYPHKTVIKTHSVKNIIQSKQVSDKVSDEVNIVATITNNKIDDLYKSCDKSVNSSDMSINSNRKLILVRTKDKEGSLHKINMISRNSYCEKFKKINSKAKLSNSVSNSPRINFTPRIIPISMIQDIQNKIPYTTKSPEIMIQTNDKISPMLLSVSPENKKLSTLNLETIKFKANNDSVEKKKEKKSKKSTLNNQFTFSPKINKNSVKLIKKKETREEFLKRMSYSNKIKNASLILREPDFKRSEERSNTIGSDKVLTTCSTENKRFRDLKKENNIIDSITDFHKNCLEKNLLNKEFVNKNVEYFKQKKLKEFYDTIKRTSIFADSIPESIREKIIIPTCSVIKKMNMEFNYKNFRKIAEEILNNFF
jgi:hypothetical protein